VVHYLVRKYCAVLTSVIFLYYFYVIIAQYIIQLYVNTVKYSTAQYLHNNVHYANTVQFITYLLRKYCYVNTVQYIIYYVSTVQYITVVHYFIIT
jgi:hypothetical protein